MGNKQKQPTLAEAYPELAAQWHPTKNGALKPDMVTCGSGKKVHWLLIYDDPESRRRFNFEWEESIHNRVKGNGCPYLSGKAVQVGFNDLATTHPQLAAQWHPILNGDLTPQMFTHGSRKSIWWLYPYDDPKTATHFDFVWEDEIRVRSKNPECPYVTGNKLWPGFNDLATHYPDIAAQWHPTKNGSLMPNMVTCQSNKRVWWLLPYDDPESGKHFDFKWEESVCNRVRGCGCPVLSGHVVWPGFNDLSTKRPELAAQWHPTHNGDLTPEMVSCGSGRIVWWRKAYIDPNTKDCRYYDWEEKICYRTSRKTIAPTSTMKWIDPSYSLAVKHPELAAQWHPTLNGNLTPYQIAHNSTMEVWWIMPYDGPESGKHFDFIWSSEVRSRTKGCGCPYLSNKGVWPGFNDLAAKRPDLAAQWDYDKNGSLTPNDVTCGYTKPVFWIYPYDDPETGRHFDFRWSESVCVRNKWSGCPFISGHRVWPGFNDLATKRPDLAAQWHPSKNKGLTPETVTCNCNDKVWWILPYDDPDTGQHYDFEWEEQICTRNRGSGCPVLSGHQVHPGFNDLASKHPDLAAQWHPTKNGDLKPEMVTCGSTLEISWLLPYDDPDTGQHFDFEWAATVANRVRGTECPYLSGHSVWPGFNDISTKRPDLAAQWHPTKNGDLTPEMVTCGSGEKIWWFFPYDDPESGKHFDFEWTAVVGSRIDNSCPFVSGHRVWPGFNDLTTKNPALAAQWHPTKNGDLAPDMVTCGSTEMVRWLLPYDDPVTGKHFDFEWDATVNSRNAGSGCPYLLGRGVWPDYNDLGSCNPDVAAEWHPTKNKRLTPVKVFRAASRKVWWKCGRCGHEWYASVKGRTIDGSSCSVCRKNTTYL